MQDFSPVASGSSFLNEKTATERLDELSQTEQGIKMFDGIDNIQSGLTGRTLPAGLQTGASFEERRNPAVRSRKLRRYGGSSETESAVEKSLHYLASMQNKDGSWGSSDSFKTGDAVALSSLALLAFFAHGENFQSEQYGDHKYHSASGVYFRSS